MYYPIQHLIRTLLMFLEQLPTVRGVVCCLHDRVRPFVRAVRAVRAFGRGLTPVADSQRSYMHHFWSNVMCMVLSSTASTQVCTQSRFD